MAGRRSNSNLAKKSVSPGDTGLRTLDQMTASGLHVFVNVVGRLAVFFALLIGIAWLLIRILR